MNLYMVSLKSVGDPFLYPLIPFKLEEVKDAFYRGDLLIMVNSKHNCTGNNNE